MTEQTDNTQDQLSEDQKAELADQERNARLWTRVQQDETDKRRNDQQMKNLGALNDHQYRDFVKRNWGYDPGV